MRNGRIFLVRRPCFKPVITCEGETEAAYFKHLADLINSLPQRKCDVVLKPHITKNPGKHAKSIVVIYERKWYHIVDKETPKPEDNNRFTKNLESLRNIKNVIRTKIIPFLGYSNASFELWLILHKADISPTVSEVKEYWPRFKKLYNLKDIKSFDDYKNADCINRVINQITLEDVKDALNRAERINFRNHNAFRERQHAGFNYFEENPSVSIDTIIRDIFNEAGLI